MTLILAYLAGLLTLVNPCVLPVLPIVLASALSADRRAPLALAAGMGLSFTLVGTGVAALGPALGLSPERVADGAALAMLAFGLVMLTPALGRGFATATAGLSARADRGMTLAMAPSGAFGGGLAGQALGGALLGAVWSPCIGPTLGAAIALASTGQGIAQAAATMAAFGLGVATLIVAGASLARGALRRNAGRLASFAQRARPVMGSVFVAVALMLLFRLNHAFEAWAIGVMPAWLVDLSVSI